MKTFEELGLCDSLLEAIRELGFETPMPIQEEVIPYLLEGDHDVIALAQTGTGKTAAFGLPILQKLDVARVCAQALVLCPTRELCMQITDDLRDYARCLRDVHVLPVYGGSSIRNQISNLQRGVHVIVATPGRLLDLMERGHVDLSQVRDVVMDEADEMLNMGFLDDISAILDAVPQERNTLLFSATMPDSVARISSKFMRNPREIVIGNRNESASSVRHICYMVQASDKYRTLKRIIDYCPRLYGIIFCRTKVECKEIADKLAHDGYNADAPHGDLAQEQRDYVMQRFRLHNIQLLVATDVAARGLDVDDLTHVINYTLPDEAEVYTHRSGRTGRAGKTGISIAIINLREKRRIREIEAAIGKNFEEGRIPTGKEICNRQIFSLIDRLEKVVVNEEEVAEILPSVMRKLEWLDKEDLLRRIVTMEFDRIISYYRDDADFETVEDSKPTRHVQVAAAGEGYTKLFIALGKMDGTTPKTLIGIINNSLDRKVELGRIDIFTRYTLIDVRSEDVQALIDGMSTMHHRGRPVKVYVATEDQIGRGKEKVSEYARSRKGGKKQRSKRGR